MYNKTDKLAGQYRNMANSFLKIGQWLFLAGVALLIVRQNSYPWPVKRASDVLFLLALVAAAVFVLRSKNFEFFRTPLSKKVFLGFALIFSGLLVSSLSGYFFDGTKPTLGGILEVGRFVEVAAIVLLVGFFEYNNSGFYKKVVLFQLSTMIYLFTLPWAEELLSSKPEMYRFQLFENWASNVGYYLIASLSFLFAALLFCSRKLFVSIPHFFVGAGLVAIMLWTQSRAAWLGIFVSFVIIIFFWARKSPKKIAAGFALAALLPILGFLVLPINIKNNVLGRFFPNVFQVADVATTPTQEVFGKIGTGELELKIRDPRRFYLWEIYSKTAIDRPFGLGPSYDPQNIVGAPQGPHNTALEYLILGGPIMLLGMVSLFILAFKNSWRVIQDSAGKRRLWPIYIFASLLGLVVASMFDNMSTFRLMWVVLGLAIFAGLYTTPDTRAPNPPAQNAGASRAS